MYKFFLPLFAILLLSCNGNKNKIVGNYYIVSFEEEDDRTISYMVDDDFFIDVIPAKVDRFCLTGDYILVIQNPRKFPENPDSNIFKYYLIPYKRHIVDRMDKNYIGPLSKAEFIKKCVDLNLDYNCIK